MKPIGSIYLAWRAGKGARRHIVGVIKENADGVRFSYLSDGVEQAKKEGFVCYTDFPDLSKEYKEGILEIFGQRLTKTERADIQEYYDFWKIEEKYRGDKFYLLAHTQGLLATDNYEFLAEYKPIKGLKFVSEVCGLSHNKLPKGSLKIGDTLTWKLEPENQYDQSAVKVYYENIEIGYIKKIHNKLFHHTSKDKIIIKVKSITEGVENIEAIFIEVTTLD